MQETCAVKFTKVWDRWDMGLFSIESDGPKISLAIFSVRLSPLTVALQNRAVFTVKARVVEVGKISTFAIDARHCGRLAVF